MNKIQKYFSEIVKVHVIAAESVLTTLENVKSNSISICIKNLRLKISNKKHRFGFDKSYKLFYIIDKSYKHYFADRARGYSLYSHGLSVRAKQLWNSYLLEEVNIDRNDVVIDCGANYADLWLILKHLIDPKNYVTFEPSNEEYRCVSINAPNCINNQIGLSNVNGETNFYLNSASADSSIIEPKKFTQITTVKTIKLDDYLINRGIEKIKLFKLEAEGLEPEVLEGAMQALKKIEYICIDGSYERGLSEEETFTPLTNVLIRNGFELCAINFNGIRGLFRNLSYK